MQILRYSWCMGFSCNCPDSILDKPKITACVKDFRVTAWYSWSSWEYRTRAGTVTVEEGRHKIQDVQTNRGGGFEAQVNPQDVNDAPQEQQRMMVEQRIKLSKSSAIDMFQTQQEEQRANRQQEMEELWHQEFGYLTALDQFQLKINHNYSSIHESACHADPRGGGGTKPRGEALHMCTLRACMYIPVETISACWICMQSPHAS